MIRRSLEILVGLAFGAIFLLLVLRLPTAAMESLVVRDDAQHAKQSSSHEALPIRQISILGERNSGTRWTYDHVSSCFGHALAVEKQLTRYKHWFQYENPASYPHDTLVLAQFRNPYDWFKAMERVPHHCPAHLRLKVGADAAKQDSQNHWQPFVTKAWTMERIGADVGLALEAPCQDNFIARDLVSCVKEPVPHSFYNHTIRYSEHQPFYELRNDGSGLPYANIMEMRSDKIRNFLAVADYEGVAGVWVVQYEYLLTRGTQHLIDRIAEWTGVTPRCEAKPAQARRQKKTRVLSLDFVQHVRLHLNWTVEKMIGYEPDVQREDEPREW